MNISSFLSEELWLVILAAIFLGICLPQPGGYLAPYAIYLLLGVMFLTGLEIELHYIKSTLQNKRNFIASFLIIFLVMPLVAFILSLPLPNDLKLGIILMATMPIGMSSTFFILKVGGDAAYALVLTTLTTLATPFLAPMIVKTLTGVFVEINAFELFVSLLELVVLPFGLALIFRNFGKGLSKRLLKISSPITSILIFLIIWGILSKTNFLFPEIWQVVLIELIMLAVGFGVGYCMVKRDRVTMGLTSASKNVTLSMVIALNIFNPVVAIPSIIWVLLRNVAIVPALWIWGRKKA